jgi:sulfate permease, SulP family
VDWLRHYRREWLGRDLLAGVTAGAVVIPQAMGYATVAGLPVEMGLYTCMVPMVVYALLGGARRLSMSTTSTIGALTGVGLVAALGASAPQTEMVSTAITLTFLVGVAVLLFWVLRLGWVVDAISDTVIIGLKVGVGFTILASQLPDSWGSSRPVRASWKPSPSGGAPASRQIHPSSTTRSPSPPALRR